MLFQLMYINKIKSHADLWLEKAGQCGLLEMISGMLRGLQTIVLELLLQHTHNIFSIHRETYASQSLKSIRISFSNKNLIYFSPPSCLHLIIFLLELSRIIYIFSQAKYIYIYK